MTFRCSITGVHFVCQVLWYPFDLVFLYMYDKDNKVTIKKLCRFNIDNTLSSLFIYDPIIRHVRINMILYLSRVYLNHTKPIWRGYLCGCVYFRIKKLYLEHILPRHYKLDKMTTFKTKYHQANCTDIAMVIFNIIHLTYRSTATNY